MNAVVFVIGAKHFKNSRVDGRTVRVELRTAVVVTCAVQQRVSSLYLCIATLCVANLCITTLCVATLCFQTFPRT